MEFEISLKDLNFYSNHGVMPEENVLGNRFIVSVSIVIPYKPGMEKDDLASTVSYAELYKIVEDEMKRTKKLLETVALKIVERIRNEYPEVIKGEISIEKCVPPIPGMIGKAEITLHF